LEGDTRPKQQEDNGLVHIPEQGWVDGKWTGGTEEMFNRGPNGNGIIPSGGQYSIGSKTEANASELKLEHHLFSYVDKEHYTTKMREPLAGLLATSIPKPSN
jgi:hypothetical protein